MSYNLREQVSRERRRVIAYERRSPEESRGHPGHVPDYGIQITSSQYGSDLEVTEHETWTRSVVVEAPRSSSPQMNYEVWCGVCAEVAMQISRRDDDVMSHPASASTSSSLNPSLSNIAHIANLQAQITAQVTERMLASYDHVDMSDEASVDAALKEIEDEIAFQLSEQIESASQIAARAKQGKGSQERSHGDYERSGTSKRTSSERSLTEYIKRPRVSTKHGKDGERRSMVKLSSRDRGLERHADIDRMSADSEMLSDFAGRPRSAERGPIGDSQSSWKGNKRGSVGKEIVPSHSDPRSTYQLEETTEVSPEELFLSFSSAYKEAYGGLNSRAERDPYGGLDARAERDPYGGLDARAERDPYGGLDARAEIDPYGGMDARAELQHANYSETMSPEWQDTTSERTETEMVPRAMTELIGDSDAEEEEGDDQSDSHVTREQHGETLVPRFSFKEKAIKTKSHELRELVKQWMIVADQADVRGMTTNAVRALEFKIRGAIAKVRNKKKKIKQRRSDPPSQKLVEFSGVFRPNYGLDGICGHALEFAKDKNGAKFIFDQMEKGSESEASSKLFLELLPDLDELMVHVYGRQVVQKYLDCGTVLQRQVIVMFLRLHTARLSFDLVGHQIVIRAIQRLEDPGPILREFRGHVAKLIVHEIGHLVIKACFENSLALHNFVKELMTEMPGIMLETPATFAFKSIIKHSPRRMLSQLVKCACEHLVTVATDAYGQQRVFNMLQRKAAWITKCFCEALRGRVIALSEHEVGWHVVNKCVTMALGGHRAMLINEVLNTPDAVTKMKSHPIAQNVFKKMLELADPDQQRYLMGEARPSAVDPDQQPDIMGEARPPPVTDQQKNLMAEARHPPVPDQRQNLMGEARPPPVPDQRQSLLGESRPLSVIDLTETDTLPQPQRVVPARKEPEKKKPPQTKKINPQIHVSNKKGPKIQPSIDKSKLSDGDITTQAPASNIKESFMELFKLAQSMHLARINGKDVAKEENAWIDKMAAVISQHPPEFENTFKGNQTRNPAFSFLFPEDRNHEFYKSALSKHRNIAELVKLSEELQTIKSAIINEQAAGPSRGGPGTSGRPPSSEARKISIRNRNGVDIGLRIERGPQGGIFVSGVTNYSLAEKKGVAVGDQILEFCGVNFRNVTKELATSLMLSCPDAVDIHVQFNPEMSKEVRVWIDKMALVISQHPPKFETTFTENQSKNPAFSFLVSGDVNYDFYKSILSQHRSIAELFKLAQTLQDINMNNPNAVAQKEDIINKMAAVIGRHPPEFENMVMKIQQENPFLPIIIQRERKEDNAGLSQYDNRILTTSLSQLTTQERELFEAQKKAQELLMAEEVNKQYTSPAVRHVTSTATTVSAAMMMMPPPAVSQVTVIPATTSTVMMPPPRMPPPVNKKRLAVTSPQTSAASGSKSQRIGAQPNLAGAIRNRPPAQITQSMPCVALPPPQVLSIAPRLFSTPVRNLPPPSRYMPPVPVTQTTAAAQISPPLVLQATSQISTQKSVPSAFRPHPWSTQQPLSSPMQQFSSAPPSLSSLGELLPAPRQSLPSPRQPLSLAPMSAPTLQSLSSVRQPVSSASNLLTLTPSASAPTSVALAPKSLALDYHPLSAPQHPLPSRPKSSNAALKQLASKQPHARQSFPAPQQAGSVTQWPAPSTRKALASTRQPGAVTQWALPSTRQMPSPRQPAPSTHQPAPSPQQPAPSPRQPAPSLRQPAPSSRQPAPFPRQTALSPRQPAPSTRQPAPSPHQPAPSSRQPAPSPRQTAPSRQPVPSRQPAPLMSQPAPSPWQPAPSSRQPAPSPRQPAPSRQPALFTHQPAPSPRQPAPSSHQPAPFPRQPAPSRQPEPFTHQPAPSARQAVPPWHVAPSLRQPAPFPRQPFTSGQQPLHAAPQPVPQPQQHLSSATQPVQQPFATPQPVPSLLQRMYSRRQTFPSTPKPDPAIVQRLLSALNPSPSVPSLQQPMSATRQTFPSTPKPDPDPATVQRLLSALKPSPSEKNAKELDSQDLKNILASLNKKSKPKKESKSVIDRKQTDKTIKIKLRGSQNTVSNQRPGRQKAAIVKEVRQSDSIGERSVYGGNMRGGADQKAAIVKEVRQSDSIGESVYGGNMRGGADQSKDYIAELEDEDKSWRGNQGSDPLKGYKRLGTATAQQRGDGTQGNLYGSGAPDQDDVLPGLDLISSQSSSRASYKQDSSSEDDDEDASGGYYTTWKNESIGNNRNEDTSPKSGHLDRKRGQKGRRDDASWEVHDESEQSDSRRSKNSDQSTSYSGSAMYQRQKRENRGKERTQRRFKELDDDRDEDSKRRFKKLDDNSNEHSKLRFNELDDNPDARTQRRFKELDDDPDARTQRRFKKLDDNPDARTQRRFKELDDDPNERTQRRFKELDDDPDERTQRRFKKLDDNPNAQTQRRFKELDDDPDERTQRRFKKLDDDPKEHTQRRFKELDDDPEEEMNLYNNIWQDMNSALQQDMTERASLGGRRGDGQLGQQNSERVSGNSVTSKIHGILKNHSKKQSLYDQQQTSPTSSGGMTRNVNPQRMENVLGASRMSAAQEWKMDTMSSKWFEELNNEEPNKPGERYVMKPVRKKLGVPQQITQEAASGSPDSKSNINSIISGLMSRRF